MILATVCTAMVALAATWWFLDGSDPKESESLTTLTAGSETFSEPTTPNKMDSNASSELASSARQERLRLARNFRKFARQFDDPIGVSFGPLNGESEYTFGELKSGVAWSTSKVPVAIAVLRAGGTADQSMDAAITQSSNEDAEAMWQSLGAAKNAGEQVDAVFAEAGDNRTSTQTKQVREPYTAFGQTVWSISRQQRFARWVACSEQAQPVFELMGEVTADQAWGIGTADPSAHFKGGWGPTVDGGYLVRQFGVMDAQDGQVAVAIMTEVATGALVSGSSVLDQLARWVQDNATGSEGC